MSREPEESSSFAVVFAVCGGLLFAGSLIVFGASYAGRFGRDAGPWSGRDGWQPALADVALFTIFAVHHSVFARTGLKAWVHSVAPPVLERSIYVWVASVLLIATCVWWRPVPGMLWLVTGPPALLLAAVQIGGAVLTLVGAHGLDNLALAGLRQVMKPAPDSAPARLNNRGPFAVVRHPIYLGWFLIVWPAPVMSGTRLVFALTSCAYLVLAIPFEERDLRRTFGADYDAYARRVRWRVIPWVY